MPIDLTQFTTIGRILLYFLAAMGGIAALSGIFNACREKERFCLFNRCLLLSINTVFTVGFLLIAWLHLRIYQQMPLRLPLDLVPWLNEQLKIMNSEAAYAFTLYNPAHPPRYIIPLWIENEKYYFWFMAYAFMAYRAWRQTDNHRLRGILQLFLGIQTSLLLLAANPFAQPLAKFFQETAPWFSSHLPAMSRLSLFMKLYPRLTFYYNASYMWLHPPLLFVSYACITITFITSLFMLIKHQTAIESLGYDFAKLGYFLLTLGMLLGYPWALQAWGPNWWWDPKICSSIMMWAVYSTYLHTRLYTNKRGMWYFTAILGILCFIAMIFTFLTSFYFPGEHTF